MERQIIKRMRKLIAFVVVVLSVSSCYYDNREELYPVNPYDCNTTNLTYDVDIQPIFINSCSVSGCHVTGAELPVLETYAQVKANLTRIEVRALIEKSMPPAGPLSTCDQKMLAQWIADGAPEK